MFFRFLRFRSPGRCARPCRRPWGATPPRPGLVGLAPLLLVASMLLTGPLAAGPRQADVLASRMRHLRDQDRVHPTEILFQAFTWNATVNGQSGRWYRHVAERAGALAEAGFTHVWLPPVSRSVSPQGYMPGDWYDLGAPGNPTFYGTGDELAACILALRKRGLAPLADVVVNHRCASHQEDGVWNVFHHASGKAWWERWALAAGDFGGTGAPDTGGDFGGAPDLDHANPAVRRDVIAFLRWLREEIGFAGFRFDFSKGYAPAYVKEYVQATSPTFTVGEYWTSMQYRRASVPSPNQDPHRQELCDWIDGTAGLATAFDFTTKGILQHAVVTGEYWRLRDAEGKASGLVGWWPSRAVTFVDNHDTGSEQAHWPFPAERVLQGYAYCLTHPGIPSVFWDHVERWGEATRSAILGLCRLRHETGVHRNSRLRIVEARHGLYAAVVDERVALALGDAGWSPGSGWTERFRRSGAVVWTLARETVEP